MKTMTASKARTKIKYPSRFTSPILVTPEIAESLLASCNFTEEERQRNVNKNTVYNYARMMKNKQWVSYCAPIQIDMYGRVIDGQHRLHAIIQSGISCEFDVIYGADPIILHTADKGRPRTIADDMNINGIKNATAVAAVSKLVYFYNRGGAMTNNAGSQYTYFDARAVLESYPYLPDVVDTYCARSLGMSVIPKSWVNLIAVLTYQQHQEECYLFFEGIHTGANLSVGSPILALLKMSQLWKDSSRNRVHACYKGAIAAMAWNKYIAGENDTKRLFWNGKKFPEIFGATKKKRVLKQL